MSKPKLDGEARVSEYLESIGLKTERYSKAELRTSKTPGFKVYSGDLLAFYCEVKTAQEDTWRDELLEKAEPGTLVNRERKDPTYNRITSYILESVDQFDAVNPSMEFPNVLAIVNGDSEAGTEDLLHIFSGNLYCDDGEVVPLFRKFSEGRIKESKWRINLVIWFDDWQDTGPQFYLPGVHESHTPRLCELFGIAFDSLSRLP